MNARRPFTTLAAAIFLLIALAHLYRVVADLNVSIAETQVPLWVSWIALVFAGVLAALLFREARR